MPVELGTMSHRSSVLVKSLDGALEALSSGHSGDIHSVALFKDISLDLISHLVIGGILKSELSEIFLNRKL